MIITIDNNNNNVHVHMRELEQNQLKDEIIVGPFKDMSRVQKLLYDIFTMYNGFNIRLDLIDEDNKTTIGEW